jgi:uncharacterized protein YlbG (UPF0298 family)
MSTFLSVLPIIQSLLWMTYSCTRVYMQHAPWFLRVFAKLRKATSFVMSVYLVVRPPAYMEQFDSHCTDFYEIWYLSFRKYVHKIQASLTSDKNNEYSAWRRRHMCIYGNNRSIRLTIKKILRTKAVKKITTRFMFNNFLFLRKSFRLWDSVEKYCTTGQATDDNTAHALHMVDNWNNCYKHTLRICNTYCFSTATIVVRKHLSIYSACFVLVVISECI